MSQRGSTWKMWIRALGNKAVWRRSLIIGMAVGSVQVAINQGDFWIRNQVTAVIVVKTLITPVIALGVALFSAAGAHVEITRQRLSNSTTGSL